MQPTIALALLLACPLAAQADHFTTSPEDYDFLEGNSHHSDLLGTEPRLRYQQIDSTNTRALLLTNRIAFRRDGYALADTEYGARTIELELTLSESDLGSISTNFATNLTTNSTRVVPRMQVQFDDWTLPQGIAAKESNVIFFGTAWGYRGKLQTGNDLLWEVKVWSNDRAGDDYPFDFEYITRNGSFGYAIPIHGARRPIGTGCTTLAGTFHLSASVIHDGTRISTSAVVFGAPPGAPVGVMIDDRDHGLVLPSLCGTLHVLNGVVISFGPTSGTGFATSATIAVLAEPSMVGQRLVYQAFSPDPAQPKSQLALSRGFEVEVPAPPSRPALGRVWAYDPSATTATVGPLPGGIIMLTNHL
ncbi:MAG: hypothetical protein AAF628_29400 [Planctomycetota bacterium]